MGMLDTVHFTCPRCGNAIEFQSKAGPCELKNYHYTNVPAEIAVDLITYPEEANICDNCFSHLELKASIPRVHIFLTDVNGNEYD